MTNDLKNKENRARRKGRHNKRAEDERAAMLLQFKEGITPLTMFATHEDEVDTLLVKFKFSTPKKIIDFYELLVKQVGDFI